MTGTIEPREAKEELAAASSLFADFWKVQEEEWKEDGGIPDTVLFGDFGFLLSSRIDQLTPVDLEKLFGVLERLLADGNQQVGEIVATGFFEALLADAADGSLDINKIKPYFGRQSIEYCIAWNPTAFAG
jgi:hypothetical protein